MNRFLKILPLLLLFTGAAEAQTINNLVAGAAVQGTDLFPAYQGANPAVAVTAAQIKTFVNVGAGLTINSTVITGGTDKRVLFDDAATLQEDAGLTFSKTTGQLTIGGKTVTTSNPALSVTQTWNAGAVTFTGIFGNFTDTASAAASLLMDLQKGGTSQFAFRKDGTLTSTGNISGGNNSYFLDGLAQFGRIGMPGTTGQLAWSTNSAVSSVSTFDTFLVRPAAATLQHGSYDAAAPVAQTIQAQSVVAGTSNTAGVDWTFNASQGTGTGIGGKINFNLAPAGTTGTAQNTRSSSFTMDTAGNFYTSGNLTLLGGGVTGTGVVSLQGASLRIQNTSDAVNIMLLAAGDWRIANGTAMSWTNSNSYSGTADTTLGRMGAAGRLGLTNGTTATTLDVYATSDVAFGAPTNYERISITKAIGGAATIDVQNGGTGAAATQFAIKLAGTTKLDYGTSTSNNWSSTAGWALGNGAFFVGTGVPVGVASAQTFGFSSSASVSANSSLDTALSRISAGVMALGTGAQGNAGGTLNLTTIVASGTIKTGGFTVAGLPAAGTAGRRAYVTDQLTTCAVAGAALTGGGAVTCPVFDNGTAWVGD